MSNEKQRKEMSRRQFLTYTLGGAGAFMAAGMVLPMVRFAVDPLLKGKSTGEFVKVVEASKITKEQQEFKFQINQIDGWYQNTPELTAWIRKDDAGTIYALSPVCKHLGCTISSNEGDGYVCPCHGAIYTTDGKNETVAPKPLDEYTVKEENGFIYLGPLKPNTRV